MRNDRIRPYPLPARIAQCAHLLTIAATVTAAPAQQWIDRTERPILDTAFFAHAGHTPMRLRAGALLAFDGQAWQPRTRLPDGTDGAIDLAFDRPRGVVVALLTSGAAPLQTWTFDGRTWRRRGDGPLDARQRPVRAQQLVFDPTPLGGGRVLALHDEDAAHTTADWQWDGSAWQPLTSNRPFGLHRVVADPVRGRLVGVGRATAVSAAPTIAGQTFVFDGAAWQPQPAAAAPTPRLHTALGFDPVSNCVLLFGGSDISGRPLDDTWAFDGIGWSQREAPHRPPGGHAGHFGFDRGRGRAVLFDTAIDSTHDWIFTGADWEPLPFAPGAMVESAIHFANDPLRRRLVRTQSTGTYEWDGVTWARTADTPMALRMAPMAFDLLTQTCVVFGGESPLLASGPALFADTWSYDGAAWTQVPGQGPPARRDHALLAHLAAKGVLLFGGTDAAGAPRGDTWQFAAGVWTDVTAALVGPSPASGPATGAADLYGIDSYLVAGSGLWTPVWNGSAPPSWSLRSDRVPGFDPAAPIRLANRTLAVDPATGAPILAVRNGDLTGLHRFDATAATDGTWTFVGELPVAVDAAAADPLRGRLLLFRDGDTYLHTDVAAAEEPIGVSCGAPAPELVGEGLPRLGSPDYRLDAFAAPGAPLWLGLDLARGHTELGNGCTIHLAAPLLLQAAIADGRGFAAFPTAVPADPLLRGLCCYAQVAQWSAFPPIALTAALRITIGD